MDTGWEEVYAGHYCRLVALLTALAGSRAEAEEAVQEAFVRALGMSGRRAVVEDPEAWLYRVAVNLLRSRWRRVLAGRRAVARLSAPDEMAAEDSERVDDRVRLLGALRRLPFEQREAIALHYLADMPVEAVAVRVGSPARGSRRPVRRPRRGHRRVPAGHRGVRHPRRRTPLDRAPVPLRLIAGRPGARSRRARAVARCRSCAVARCPSRVVARCRSRAGRGLTRVAQPARGPLWTLLWERSHAMMADTFASGSRARMLVA